METLSPVADSGPITVEDFERQIAFLIQAFVRGHAVGKVVGAETGFVLFDDPPTVRAPDVAFVGRERLPIDRRSFARLAPDLAVEIVSPSNTISGIQDKVSDYLDAGTRLVWVVEPRGRTVTVYRSREDIEFLTPDREVGGGGVLPGFRIKVSEFFAD